MLASTTFCGQKQPCRVWNSSPKRSPSVDRVMKERWAKLRYGSVFRDQVRMAKKQCFWIKVRVCRQHGSSLVLFAGDAVIRRDTDLIYDPADVSGYEKCNG
jgi:hypothetical protein